MKSFAEAQKAAEGNPNANPMEAIAQMQKSMEAATNGAQ